MSQPADPSTAPDRPGCGVLLWFLVTVLVGVAYIGWVAWVEGARIWVVLGLILLVAACAGIAHRLMAMTRR